MRGNQPTCCPCTCSTRQTRSIPACAGEPTCPVPASSITRIGSIPACAGEPINIAVVPVDVLRSILACAVYPSSVAAQGRGQAVYPPRVRRNLGLVAISGIALRSIPACAGEPLIGGWRLRRRMEVYPRVCGGTSEGAFVTQSLTRTVYPRVCGGTAIHAGMQSRCGRTRSIPACAGEPNSICAPGRKCQRVYPRVCGGTRHSPAPALSGDTLEVYPRVCGGTPL